MKFICHLKIVDQNLARISFVVTRESDQTFRVAPVQTFLPSEADHLSPLRLTTTNGKWYYEFETESKPVPSHLLSEIIKKLEERLEAEIDHNRLN